MKKLALLLSLLALGALGLTACGGGGDDEVTAVSEAATVTTFAPPLSARQQIERYANKWAALFADGRAACRFMGQPACERQVCKRVSTGPIKNCTPPSPEFRESFADATVERVVIEGHHATAEFSNGESVEFEGQKVDEGDITGWGRRAWFITEGWIKNAEATLSPKQKIEQTANEWAPLFAAGGPRAGRAGRFMTQPALERMSCTRAGNSPIENCTPPSPGFLKSFEDATVQDIAIKGEKGGVRFSNGETVELDHVAGPDLEDPSRLDAWFIHRFGGNAGREFFQ